MIRIRISNTSKPKELTEISGAVLRLKLAQNIERPGNSPQKPMQNGIAVLITKELWQCRTFCPSINWYMVQYAN